MNGVREFVMTNSALYAGEVVLRNPLTHQTAKTGKLKAVKVWARRHGYNLMDFRKDAGDKLETF